MVFFFFKVDKLKAAYARFAAFYERNVRPDLLAAQRLFFEFYYGGRFFKNSYINEFLLVVIICSAVYAAVLVFACDESWCATAFWLRAVHVILVNALSYVVCYKMGRSVRAYRSLFIAYVFYDF